VYQKNQTQAGTVFACRSLVFSIHIYTTEKLQKTKKETLQTIDTLRFETFAVSFAVALQWLCSFMTFLSETHKTL